MPVIHFAFVIWLTVFNGFIDAQTTKLKVAYPTTVGAIAVVWVAKEAKLFEKHGLDGQFTRSTRRSAFKAMYRLQKKL